MKYTTFPSIHDIKISTGERSWTFSRSRFKLISPKLYSLTDINFFSGYSTQENNIVLGFDDDDEKELQYCFRTIKNRSN